MWSAQKLDDRQVGYDEIRTKTARTEVKLPNSLRNELLVSQTACYTGTANSPKGVPWCGLLD